MNWGKSVRSVEMFSGCGGLALGLARAGFEHLLLVERDKHSVANVRHNIARGIQQVDHWEVHSDDVRAVNWRIFKGLVEFTAGGPPCQPFSIGGLHRGEEDSRDMWPEAVRAVRQIAPKGFLFENVRGLLRPKFADHLDSIRLSLTEPDLVQREYEDRASHLERLRAHKAEGTYRVMVVKVNAADYGAPQKRHRVLFMGVHKSVAPLIEAPKPSHSRERLLGTSTLPATIGTDTAYGRGRPGRETLRIAVRWSSCEGTAGSRRGCRGSLSAMPSPIWASRGRAATWRITFFSWEREHIRGTLVAPSTNLQRR